TCAGAKMWGLDSVFVRCRALSLLTFLGGFEGALVSRPKNALRTRVRAFSLQRPEQNRCCRARRATLRPQLAQATLNAALRALMAAPSRAGAPTRATAARPAARRGRGEGRADRFRQSQRSSCTKPPPALRDLHSDTSGPARTDHLCSDDAHHLVAS